MWSALSQTVWSYLPAIHTNWTVYCSCLAYLQIVTMKTLSTHLNLTKHQGYQLTTSKEGNSVITSTTTNCLTSTLNKLFMNFYKRNVCQCQNSETWNSTYKCNLKAFLQQKLCLKQNQHNKSGLHHLINLKYQTFLFHWLRNPYCMPDTTMIT